MSKVLYLDESGDLGFGKSGSSKYLVVAYIATEHIVALKRIMRRARRKAKIPRNVDLKGPNLTEGIRNRVLTKLSEMENIEVGAVIIDKTNIYNHLKTKRLQNVLYAYAAGLILIPYLVNRDGCHVNIDERSIKNRDGNMIDNYLRIRLAVKHRSSHVFSFAALESHKALGLQAAHVVANTIWRKYEKGYAEAYRIIEPKIIDEFKPF